MSLNQDVRVYAALVDGDESLTYDLAEGRVAWVHIARGTVELNGEELEAGDGASIEDAQKLVFANAERAEFLLFDMRA